MNKLNGTSSPNARRWMMEAPYVGNPQDDPLEIAEARIAELIAEHDILEVKIEEWENGCEILEIDRDTLAIQLADCDSRLAAVKDYMEQVPKNHKGGFQTREYEAGYNWGRKDLSAEVLREILSPDFTCPGCAEKDQLFELLKEDKDRWIDAYCKLEMKEADLRARLGRAREAWAESRGQNIGPNEYMTIVGRLDAALADTAEKGEG